jgi:hypothetical protein
MDTQEMMERLLATINANQAKSDADRKADKDVFITTDTSIPLRSNGTIFGYPGSPLTIFLVV